MYGLLFDQDMAVWGWANKTYDLFPVQFYRAVGVVDAAANQLVGAAIYQNYTGTNVDLSYYGQGTLTLGIVRSLAKIAVHMGVARGTLVTSKRNKRFVRSLRKLGFELEGTQRCYYGHEDNTKNTAVRLVMFKSGLEKLGQTHPEALIAKKEAA
jgi:hypothetical protein